MFKANAKNGFSNLRVPCYTPYTPWRTLLLALVGGRRRRAFFFVCTQRNIRCCAARRADQPPIPALHSYDSAPTPPTQEPLLSRCAAPNPRIPNTKVAFARLWFLREEEDEARWDVESEQRLALADLVAWLECMQVQEHDKVMGLSIGLGQAYKGRPRPCSIHVSGPSSS